ncbi:MAG: hypothetical protein M1816_007148 [Peltula sp. TS41687]|nr:MAG: hypothetical protein M1816_007148 [Peltula sp. TS41687]
MYAVQSILSSPSTTTTTTTNRSRSRASSNANPTTTATPLAATETSVNGTGNRDIPSASSIKYIERSLSRASLANPKLVNIHHLERIRASSPHHRTSPPLYGHSGTAPPPGMFVRALYDYEADDRTSLSFHEGDLIQVLTQLETGWWDGVLRGVRGWFPSNYCALVTDPDGDALRTLSLGEGEDVDGELDEDEEEEEDDPDREQEDVDSEGHHIDESPQLPLEGTATRNQEEAGFWIPQATVDGRLFYFNTLTCDSTMELPLETSTSANETSPVHPNGVNVPSKSKISAQMMAQGMMRPEDDTGYDGTSGAEFEAELRKGKSHNAVARRRENSEASHGVSPATSIDSIGNFSPGAGAGNGIYVGTYPGFSSGSGHTLGALPSIAAPFNDHLSAEVAGNTGPHSFFEDGAMAPMTWNRLVENMRSAVERYREAIANSARSEYVKRAQDISDNLRLLLAAGSGTTDNHSGQPSIILTNKPLYPHYRDMMSKFSKLVLSSHIAAADWPTPESYAKCLHEADGVLQAVYGYVEVARQQRGENIPRLVPGFLLGSTSGSTWRNNGLVSELPTMSGYLDRGDHEPYVEPPTRLDGVVLARLDDWRHALTAHLRRLDEHLLIKDKVVTSPRHEVIGHAVCIAASNILEDLRKWIWAMESIDLRPFGSMSQNLSVMDYFMQKQRLYDLSGELIMSCQATTAPLGDEWAELRGDLLEDRLRQVSIVNGQLESCIGQLLASLQYLDEIMPGDRYQIPIGDAHWRSSQEAVGEDVPELTGSLDSNMSPRSGNIGKAAKILGTDPSQHQPPETEEKPEYLRLDYEDELVFDDRVKPPQLKGGTLAGLVERLTWHDKLDQDFNDTFLLTYRSFTTASELFDMLVMRFSIQPPYGLAPDDYQLWVDKKQRPIRLRVVNILKKWVGNHWMESQDDESREVLCRAYDFAEKSITASNTPGAQPLMAVLEQRIRGQEPNAREMVRNHNTPMPPPILPKNPKKLKFLDIDVLELARQLTIIESNLYAKIKPTECLNKTWQKKPTPDDPEPAVNVRALILHSNRMTNWVADMILTQSEVKKRAMVTRHFIAVAEKCRSLHNYSTLTSIMSALGTSAIDRLKRTWDQIPPKSKNLLESMRELMSGQRNYSVYREALANSVPPCVPFFGTYLTDLTFIEDGISSNIKKSSLINFQKRARTAEVIRHIQSFQNVPYALQPVADLQSYILTNLRSATDVADLWKRSLEVEPKEREDEKIAR